MPPSPANQVRKRSVFLIGGYEPKSSDAFFKRTRRELARYADTWDATAEMEAASLSEDQLVATARIQAQSPSGQVDTHFNFFVWNDIVLGDFAKPMVVRVAKYVLTVLDYLVSGTFASIVKHAWRFSAYFLYPAIALAVISVAAMVVGAGIASVGFPASAAAGCTAAVALWYGLLKLAGRRWFVLHLMDLWSFSSAYLHGRRPDAERHVQRYASAVVLRARHGEDDEIVLVGHSTGGALILDIAATAIAMYPQLGSGKAKVTILTVGSTALKIGLHPAADRFRTQVQKIVDCKGVDWVECQSKTDAINFYRTDPAAAMQLEQRDETPIPQVHLVRIRDTLQPEAYKRFRYNFFRVHYQFIMANTRQYAYDFFVMCCSDRLFRDSLGTSLLYTPPGRSERAEPSSSITELEQDKEPEKHSSRIAA